MFIETRQERTYMKPNTHYTPTENGYAISGSQEVFNRVLYGSHKNDDKRPRFFTFAGDAPLFMGADMTWGDGKGLYGVQAKCGVLHSGLALTPGRRTDYWYSKDIDVSSRWFHNSEDVAAEFKNGWMEYELTQLSPWLPDVKVNMEAYPLLPEDGFLVHYQISTDQRIVFAAGFGGMTDYFGRFEYKDEPRRNFSAADCEGNTVTIGKNRAVIQHPNGNVVRIATSFDAEFGLGSAKSLAEPYAGAFLGSEPENENDQVVKISRVLEPGEVFDGYILVVYKEDEKAIDQWLATERPIESIKQQIYQKHACISVNTPENPLDLTVAPTVLAMDASWHKNSFHHAAFSYHLPFLGWRNWYAPTALGWGDRVETTMEAHLAQLPKGPVSEERIWIDKTPKPDGSGRQYPSQYHCIENTTGRMVYFLDPPVKGAYNMQECALDMMLYYLEWSGNLAIAEKYFDDFCAILDWEERVLDPDGDGVYQNYLNTWISDGHSYNGGACTQSSAYNYRANLQMAKIAEKIGRDATVFQKRAEKIKKASIEKLWIPNLGIMAESLDTIGNCLIHPSPELSTTYLAIDCDLVDDFKAYTMLKYTENYIKSVVTPASDGRLSFCSNWLPKKYSTYGIFPAENAHLALTYFKLGLIDKAKEILDGLVDCYFMGKNPGMASHVQSARCTSDLGDMDFTDVSGTYLRLVVEGLFGIRINTLDGVVSIAPGFPKEWNNASLTLKDISLHYNRKGKQETFDIFCDRPEKKRIRIPMISTNVEAVLVDGVPASYEIVSSPGNSFLFVEVDKVGKFQLCVMHGGGTVPTLDFAEKVLAGNEFVFEVKDGAIAEIFDVCETLEDITQVGNKVYAKAKRIPGHHTLFIRVISKDYDAWIPADYEIEEKEAPKAEPCSGDSFEPVDMTAFFNCNMTEIHKQQYLSPRPEGFSVGVHHNGRYAWEWNHGGHNAVIVDDSLLRNAKGVIKTNSGISFATPAENENVACVSIWDNFPTDMSIPLSGKGQEIAVLFISTTNAIQTGVENVRITVTYADGEETSVKLVYPLNIDDWLASAFQGQNENFYFSDFNHATVQRIKIDKSKELANIKIEAIANEVIMGVLGVSISR